MKIKEGRVPGQPTVDIDSEKKKVLVLFDEWGIGTETSELADGVVQVVVFMHGVEISRMVFENNLVEDKGRLAMRLSNTIVLPSR